MNWFYNMKISAKLLTGFIIVAILAGVVGVIGIVNMKSLANADIRLYETGALNLGSVATLNANLHRMRSNFRDIIISDNPTEVKAAETKIAARIETIDTLITDLGKNPASKKSVTELNAFTASQEIIKSKINDFYKLVESNNLKEAKAAIADDGFLGKPARDAQDNLESLTLEFENYSKIISEDNTKQANGLTILLIIAIAVSMLMAILLGLIISNLITKPLKQLVHMLQEMSMGHLGLRLKMDTKDEIGQMASVMDSFADDLQNVVVVAMKKISNGDLSAKITLRDDEDEIFPALKHTIESIEALIREANMLSEAAVAGHLDIRGNAAAFSGGYREIIEGVNKTLDAVMGPLNVAAEYMDRISKGDIPPVITESYNGDFNGIKNNLNTCINAINAMVLDTNLLVEAAVSGRLDTRADAGRHGGDFSKIIEGMNKTLDAIIAPVNEAFAVLQEMAKGNLSVSMQGHYMGDHAVIKDVLNDTISTILSYVSEISSVLTEMAAGNLQQAITADYRGDFVEIKNSLNNIIGSLNEVLGDINDAADQVASGSRQVSDGSQALSQGSTEQASSIEELTASITEIASQTKQNAINANQANELATTAKENAASGNAQMIEMVNSMKEINVSSANISKIIKVIDEIAFQTNILALNAAVEAARAGQHGKGFAVVAEEVRNLAARSANAAKETTDLIEGSIAKVKAGTKIANETAEALVQIVSGVDKAARLVGDIAAASNEQATGISQVNKGIEQVSQVIQNNSATAEESAAASEELSSQAELLKEMISRFRLKKSAETQIPHETRMLAGGGDSTLPKSAERPSILLSQDESDKY